MSDGTDHFGTAALPPHPIVLLVDVLTPLVRIGWTRLMKSDEARTIALLLGGAVGGVAVGWMVRDAMG